ncbi:MAG: hypothetical protein M3Y82_06770, partial [Verrucomicrobiota bacterium]|nr:hypothetical protein [Verrucomicrobiota bacterium]
MKLKNLLSLGAALCSLFAMINPVCAQVTAFTYNGRLNTNGAPVNGPYDLRFTLYDANAAGNVVAGPLLVSPVDVANGLFTARLDFGANVFTGPPRWLSIEVGPVGAGDFTVLSPRQEVTSSPYAIRAQTAGTAADVNPSTVVKSLNGLRDDVSLLAGANVTITPNGNTLTLAAAGTSGGGIWNLNGTNAYYNGGNVGIGSTNPQAKLEVAAQNALRLVGYQPFLTISDSNAGNARGRIQSVGGDMNIFTESYLSGANPFSFLKVANNGNVGIGSAAPVGKLEVVAQDALRLVGYGPFLTILDSGSGYARSRIQGVGGDLDLFTESYLSGVNPYSFLKVANNGNVGIGSAAPVGKLEVVAQDALRLIGYQPFLTLYDNNAGYARSRIQSVGGEMLLVPETYLNGSDGNAYVKLFNSGNFSVKSLTIRGGADLAEPFDLSSAEIAKGSVVVIDEDHAGHLKLSDQAYDTHVAGIVSGANGINPGIALQQEGVNEGGQNVALS